MKPILPAAVLGALSVFLAGCGAQGVSDDRIGRMLVSPDKYQYYTCEQIAIEAKTKSTREAELKVLMAKAGRGPSGEVASALAYRPEYLQIHSEMNELRKASADRECAAPGALPSLPAEAAPQRR